MSLINFLNCKFLYFKSMHKYKLIDYIVNNIQLIQNLTCVLRAQRKYNLTVRFSKYVVMFILLSKVITRDKSITRLDGPPNFF